MSHSRQ